MAAGPNINLSSNPDFVVGGSFGAIIDASQVAAQVTGDLTVAGNLAVNGSFNPQSISTAGNLVFTGTTVNSNHIMGDMSNSDWNKRVTIMNSIADTSTNLEITPNGTAVSAGINLENASTIGNNAYLNMTVNTTRGLIGTFTRGTGIALPLFFATGTGAGVVALFIDANQNVSVGKGPGTVGFYGSYGVAKQVTPAATVAPTLTGLVYADDSAAIQTALNNLTTEVNALRTIIANLNLSA